MLERGWAITWVRREATGGAIALCDKKSVKTAIAGASHILSCVPPERTTGDTVLASYSDALSKAPASWIGYLSSTGVYGDAKGAWVDENAPLLGRRVRRIEADLGWQALGSNTCVLRLPGIYGPGRSIFERIAEGRAHRIDLPNQVFSRIHVADISSAIINSFSGPAGVYNIADDLPSSQNQIVELGCEMMGLEPPAPILPSDASLSNEARAFYSENRRVGNGKAKRLLNWKPLFPTYAAGLRDCMAMASPSNTSAAPPAAKADHA